MHSSIPIYWGIEPAQDQGHPPPLMPNKAILCYIWSWSHGSLHVYSLVGGSVLGSSGGYWLVDIIVFPMGLQTPSAPSVFPLTPPGSLHSVLVGCLHPICIGHTLTELECSAWSCFHLGDWSKQDTLLNVNGTHILAMPESHNTQPWY